MPRTTIHQLSKYGQSIWLDYISRSLIDSGKLNKFIEDGLRGMTSNPSIFNQSITTSSDYDEKIIQLKGKKKSTFEIYDELTIKDIQDAADAFTNVYNTSNRLDGYVSLEINPLLAQKVDEQIKEGKRLYKKVNRPNVMIKVPATLEGFSVVEELIAEGINVNVTLIFSLQQYRETAKAYLRGLEKLAKKTDDLSNVRSVASVFVSRIDTAVDKLLDENMKVVKNEKIREKLESLKGKAAVANCRVIYEEWKDLFRSDVYEKLHSKKANIQRVLWASTSAKNPAFSDVKYVTELITRSTVNTLPEPTWLAFLDHGRVKDAFADESDEAYLILKSLKEQHIDMDEVCAKLLEDGCGAFNNAFESLLATLEKKAEQLTLKP